MPGETVGNQPHCVLCASGRGFSSCARDHHGHTYLKFAGFGRWMAAKHGNNDLLVELSRLFLGADLPTRIVRNFCCPLAKEEETPEETRARTHARTSTHSQTHTKAGREAGAFFLNYYTKRRLFRAEAAKASGRRKPGKVGRYSTVRRRRMGDERQYEPGDLDVGCTIVGVQGADLAAVFGFWSYSVNNGVSTNRLELLQLLRQLRAIRGRI